MSAAPAHGPVPVTQQHMTQSMGEPARPSTTWDPIGLEPMAEKFPLQSEQGQCHPRFMRLTVNAFPNSQALAQRFNLPFGIAIQPMHLYPGQTQDDVPVVNFGASGVMRCRRCRTYINPFVSFLDAGRRWRCNVCGLVNDLPAEYFCNLDANNRRRDIDERPELLNGSVELVAPAEYMVRAPQPPVYVFLIDVSLRAVQSGMLATAVSTIKSCLEQLPVLAGDTRTQIAFITFDTNFTFYNLKAGLGQPQALVVSDLDKPFLPLPSDLLVNLHDSKELIESFLDRMPTIFAQNDAIESCLGPALQAAYMLMMHVGGKLLVFQSILPSLGRGALQSREDVKLLGTEKEAVMLQPATDYYKTIALDCSKNQICVDLFTFPQQYIDLASLSPLSKFTGGQLYHYPGFDASRDADTFAHDLRRTLLRNTGFEAVMRVRCTKGVKVHAFHGNYYLRGADLLALPNIDCDKGFACEISHEEQQISCSHVCMQCALLYTTSTGERRIRVHTLNVPVVSTIADLYAAIDTEAMVTVMGKAAIDMGISTKLAEARARLQDRFVSALRTYRAMMQQVALPRPLELLPMYILAILKSPVLKDGVDVRTDERTSLALAVGGMNIAECRALFVPNLFSIHTLMEGNFGTVGQDGQVVMPPLHPLSLEHLSAEGMYLLENGLLMMLWVGRSCPAQLLQAVLNVQSADRLDSVKVYLQDLGNPMSQRVCAIAGAIRAKRTGSLPVYCIRQGGAGEARFLSALIEDRTLAAMSYSEWWASLARSIG